MSDYVSFETAVKLKKLGFPPPQPKEGQLWESITKFGGWIEGVYGETVVFTGIDTSKDMHEEWPVSRWLLDDFPYIFRPTATDILRQLDQSEWCLRWDFDGFVCWDSESFSAHETHENPAEACAAAWLKRKGK